LIGRTSYDEAVCRVCGSTDGVVFTANGFVWFGCGDSLVARATGKRWPMLKPIDHVTMLCAKSYAHFQLEDLANVYHGYSEFPYEFAATLAAVLKAGFRRQGAESTDATAPAAASNGSTPPPLRELGLKTQFLKGLLTVASAPAWLIAAAMDKQACLNTMIVRKSA
jgi:hypothetical protein